MTYGQALGVGLLTVVFASVLSSIYTYLLYAVIDPSLQDQLRLFTEEQIVKQGRVPEEQMDMALEMATKFQTPGMMMVMGIFGGAFAGLIISLITAIFTQKKPQDDFTE
jgi:phage shock protein PspC (stress-responsive transcriptional regulator)